MSGKGLKRKTGDNMSGEASQPEEKRIRIGRSGFIDWEQYFMDAAILAAKRSDLKSGGACIVNKNRVIVSIGYDNVCHAEINAILNKNCCSVEGCTMYVTKYPCNECAKLIVQSGIEKIIYLNDCIHDDSRIAAEEIFDAAEVNRSQSSSTTFENNQEMQKLEASKHAMNMALLSARRSKDRETQVGACIVDENGVIVSVGYNGMPRLKVVSNDTIFSWDRKKPSPSRNKHHFVCHAEANAILNKNCRNVKGCKIYVTLFPCDKCAELIVESGINGVFYDSDEYDKKDYTKKAKKILTKNNIPYMQFDFEN